AAAAAVVLALAGLSIEHARPAAGVCVVAAIDVSASVQRAARDAARDYLAEIVPALGENDVVGSVGFAGRARVVAHPAAGRRALAALLPPEDVAALETDETDIAAAL